MTTLSTPTLILFGVSAVVFTMKFVRSKQWRTLTPKALLTSLKALLLVSLPLLGVILLAKTQSLAIAGAAPFFMGSAVCTYLLSQSGLAVEMRAILLLVLSVVLTNCGLSDSAASLAIGSIAGILVWKTAENLLQKPESRLDDIFPAIVWLSGFYWTTTAVPGATGVKEQQLLLGVLTLAVFLRWIQALLLAKLDPMFLKRIMLSLTGGLGMLIFINQILHSPNDNPLAWLVGAGFFFAYIISAFDRSVDESTVLVRSLKNILLVGILTLVASRLYGTEGMLLLAGTSVVSPLPGAALLAGMFWGSRVLLESYIFQFDPNVTGINVLHSYTSAALYAGFIIVAVMALLVRDIKNRRILTAIFVATFALVPGASNYFMHSEPTASMLLAVCITGILMSMLAPAIFRGQAGDQENVMLLPMQFTTFALLTSELLEKGDASTTHDKLMVIGALAFIVLCIAMINKFVLSDGEKRSPLTPDAPSAPSA